MERVDLSIAQRILAVFIYMAVFIFSCHYFSNDWDFLTDPKDKYNLLFVSGALLLIFGSYIAEPFFTKPVDVITNSTAVILALLSIDSPENFVGYKILFISACVLLALSICVIFLSRFQKVERFQRVLFEILAKAGQSKVVFSFIYIFTIFSYFRDTHVEFAFFLTFWIVLITQFFVEGLLVWASKVLDFILNNKKYSEILGQAIGCENPFLYQVEVDFLKHKARNTKRGELVYLSLDKGVGVVGIIINEKQLLNKKWVTIYLLEHEDTPLKIDIKTKKFISETNTIFSRDNAVYSLDIETIKDDRAKELIRENYIYKNKDNFVGHVTDGSDINKIRFHALIDLRNEKYKSLKEGAIIKTNIYGQETLFQIIDGKTYEEQLEKHDTYGYLTGIAQKLGKYNKEKQELETVKWLPNIYSPVFLDETDGGEKSLLSVGKLPMTNLEIILKDPDALITHNTAILGILGIGKSCLAFELVQKVVTNTVVKVICIDITNEYKKELPQYFKADFIQNELSDDCLQELKTNNKDGNQDNPNSWGNEDFYKSKLDEEFDVFYKSEKRILLLNPDWHNVSKSGSQFKIQHKIDLTISEKTRIITERLFVYSKNQWDLLSDEERKTNKARFLLVFEEAHSLIPEWNSTANPGDQSASNGTAKVVLQGRKYGLGSFVVTQRTANISKSILNQCNTIFALRVFDDTGKQFLENYIGSDYSNTLPTLEERHAIVVGKALKLKQPVIIQLNDRANLINANSAESELA